MNEIDEKFENAVFATLKLQNEHDIFELGCVVVEAYFSSSAPSVTVRLGVLDAFDVLNEKAHIVSITMFHGEKSCQREMHCENVSITNINNENAVCDLTFY